MNGSALSRKKRSTHGKVQRSTLYAVNIVRFARGLQTEAMQCWRLEGEMGECDAELNFQLAEEYRDFREFIIDNYPWVWEEWQRLTKEPTSSEQQPHTTGKEG